MQEKTRIELQDVSHVFNTPNSGSVYAVDRINISVPEGRFASIIGPSGCGKTTLFNIIAGLEQPTQGAVTVDGQDVTGMIGIVGYMLQKDLLFPWRTVLDNICLGMELQGVPMKQARERAMPYLQRYGLGGFEDRYPAALSGGMKQRAAFCRAMISDPRLLLLDEPFGALDALTREELSLELSRLWQELGRAALLITHDIEEAILLGDRVLIMSERPGTIRADITIDLPRPRDADTVKLPRFQEIKNQIRDIIFNRTGG